MINSEPVTPARRGSALVLLIGLGLILVIGILGTTGIIKMAGQKECEEAGGVFIKSLGVRKCLMPDEIRKP